MNNDLKEISQNSNTFLFVWNPKRWEWNTLEDDIEKIYLNGRISQTWYCSNTHAMQPGDRAFIIKVGTEPKGIIGSGIVTSEPVIGEHWSGEESKKSFYVDIEIDILLNPNKSPILTIDILKTGILSQQLWIPQASAIAIKPEIVDELEAVWFNFLTTQKIKYNPYVPTNDEEQQVYVEGAPNKIVQTRYERNPFARKKCIEHYGNSCVVCGFNFEKVYGEIGKDFIHVHHLQQIAIVGKSYQIDPIKDLRPICPNCHSIIHRNKHPLTIDEVINLIKKIKSKIFNRF